MEHLSIRIAFLPPSVSLHVPRRLRLRALALALTALPGAAWAGRDGARASAGAGVEARGRIDAAGVAPAAGHDASEATGAWSRHGARRACRAHSVRSRTAA